MVSDGNDNGDDGDGQQVDVDLRSPHSIPLLMESKSTSEVAHAEHEETIGQDGAEHGGLHDAQFTLDQSEDRNDQLDGVAEGGVEQTSEGVADAEGELFRCKSEKGGTVPMAAISFPDLGRVDVVERRLTGE